MAHIDYDKILNQFLVGKRPENFWDSTEKHLRDDYETEKGKKFPKGPYKDKNHLSVDHKLAIIHFMVGFVKAMNEVIANPSTLSGVSTPLKAFQIAYIDIFDGCEGEPSRGLRLAKQRFIGIAHMAFATYMVPGSPKNAGDENVNWDAVPIGPEIICEQANLLMKELNNIRENLRTGDSLVNSTIQERADYHMKQLPNGSTQMTPVSKRIAATHGKSIAILITPTGSRMLSSDFCNPLAINDLTPKSYKIIESHFTSHYDWKKIRPKGPKKKPKS